MFEVNHHPSVSELRKFGLTILIGLAVIGGVLWWIGAPDEGASDGLTTARKLTVGLWIAGAAVAVLSFAPPVGRLVYIAWMTAATTMGKIMTPVLFTLLYVVILPVFSLIRLKDPLRIKKKACQTYWLDHEHHDPTIERMMKPF